MTATTPTALPLPTTSLDADAFSILADENPAGMIVHRLHRPLYVNAAWAACHGYSADEVLAMPSLLPFLVPEERERMQRYARDRFAGRSVPSRYAYKAMHRDGSTMWVDALVRLVNWQGEPAVMNTIIQVDTEKDAVRIEAIERVFRDHHLYLAILSQVQHRISVVNADLTYRFCNQRNLEYHGLTSEQMVGRPVRDIIGADDFVHALPFFQRCLAGEAVNYQRRLHGPDGPTGWIDVSMRPFREGGDDIEGLVVAIRDITELHRAQEATQTSEARLRSVLTAIPGSVFLKDAEGRYQVVNRAFERMFDLREHEAIGHTVFDIADPQTAGDAHAHDLRVMSSGIPSDSERTLVRGDTRLVLNATKFPVFNDEGDVVGLGGVEFDITERKNAERDLEESERRLSTLMSNLPGMAYRSRWSPDTVVTEFVSEGCKALTGHDPADACSGEVPFMRRITHPDDLERTRSVIREARETGRRFQMRYRIITRDGEVRWVWEQGHALRLGDERYVMEGFITDISESQRLSERLTYQARHDPLTDLLNRRAFEEYLESAVTRSSRSGEESALVYLDLDRFKVVNDTCGHTAGDELLRQITSRMRQSVRRQDVLARLGGDEFALLMEHCTVEQARRVAEELLRAVREFRFEWHGQTFTVGASIGLVPITGETTDSGDLMVAADNACYVAKDSGRDRIHVYQVGDRDVGRLSGQSLWLTRIQEALESERLVLHAQAIVPIGAQTDGTPHYEVLLRMRDDTGSLVPPGSFLPAAERFGLSSRLDRWVVSRVLTHLQQQRGRTRLSVNLSARSITDDDFLASVSSELDASGIDASCLCFEITETAAIANLNAATAFIEALRRRGCRFSLDDFGSGLSSFGYLKTLPVDYLKIDGLFVRDIATDPIDLALVRSINDIGKVMGKRTIAEFVEDDAILARLRAIGVDFAQGFAIARPQPLQSLR